MTGKNVREVFTGFNTPKPFAPGSDIMALIIRESYALDPKPEKIVFEDVEVRDIFDPEKLVPANLRFPDDFGWYEDMIRGKEVPKDGADKNKAQMLLSRHPLIDSWDGIYTKDEVQGFPEGIFRNGDDLVVICTGVATLDGQKRELVLFALAPRHDQPTYGCVEIQRSGDNYVASETATICQIVNCY